MINRPGGGFRVFSKGASEIITKKSVVIEIRIHVHKGSRSVVRMAASS